MFKTNERVPGEPAEKMFSYMDFLDACDALLFYESIKEARRDFFYSADGFVSYSYDCYLEYAERFEKRIIQNEHEAFKEINDFCKYLDMLGLENPDDYSYEEHYVTYVSKLANPAEASCNLPESNETIELIDDSSESPVADVCSGHVRLSYVDYLIIHGFNFIESFVDSYERYCECMKVHHLLAESFVTSLRSLVSYVWKYTQTVSEGRNFDAS